MISATMWSLLTGLKDLLATEQTPGGTLSQIQQIKRGMLAPRSPFPQISLIPTSERYISFRSGRRAVMRKSVEAILYWRDLRGSEGIADMQSHVDAMATLIEGARQLPSLGTPRAMNAEIGSAVMSQNEVNQRIYNSATISIAYTNKEDLPDPTITTPASDSPDFKSVADSIYENLNSDSSITSDSNVFNRPFGPFNFNRSCVIVEPDAETSSPVFAGADQVSQPVNINIMSPIRRSADKELQDHLTLIESVKTRIWTDINLEGQARSRVASVSHGSTIQDSRTLYISEVRTEIMSKANVTPA